MAFDAPAPSSSSWEAFRRVMGVADRPPDDLILLRRARDRIAQGWCQRASYDPQTNGVCFLGALLCAVQDTVVPRPSNGIDEARIERLAPLLGFARVPDIIGFNDYVGRRKEQVLAVFDSAIARLEWTRVSAVARVQWEQMMEPPSTPAYFPAPKMDFNSILKLPQYV